MSATQTSVRSTYHSEELPKACWFLAANTEQAVQTACPQGYVETPALGELLDELEERGACLVTGLPGHGKTALALQAMGSLAASHNLKPLWLTRPEQWEWIPGGNQGRGDALTQLTQPMEQDDVQCQIVTEESHLPPSTPTVSDQQQRARNTTHSHDHDSRRYVVLVDDMFGKGHYDDSQKKAWEKMLDLILAKVRAKQVKLILTSRAHIYEECRKSLRGHPLFDDVKNIDLRKPRYWTVEDRKDILNNFLQQANVSVAEPIWTFIHASERCTQIGFPQLCRFFASEKQAQLQGPDFFYKPLQFLYKQFENLQENDPKSHLILIMTWLEGGVLSSEFLSSDNADSKKRISDLCEQFGVKDAMTIREAQSKARSLCGVYLSEDDEGCFRFTHQSICDSLAVAVCRSNLKQALDVCSIQQLCEYVHTKISATDQSGLTYTVRKSERPLLAARLVKAMTTEEVSQVLHHSCLQDQEFVTELIGKHLTASHVSLMLQMKCLTRMTFPTIDITYSLYDNAYENAIIITSTVAALIRAGLWKLTNHILESEELASLPEAERCRHLREALLAACYVSDREMVSRLLDRGAEVTSSTVRAACRGERDSVSVLEEVFVKLPGKELDHLLYGDLLWTCCVKSNIKCLKFLLTEARPKPHEAVFDRMLTRVLEESHPENRQWSARQCIQHLPAVLSELESTGAKLDKASFDIRRAAGHPNAFALKKHLADFAGRIPDFYGYNGATLLHEAAGWGSVECLQVLLKSPQTRHMDVNALDKDAQTPLHRAVKGSHIEAIGFLLQEGADPNLGEDEMKWRVQEGNQYFSRSGTHCSPLHAAAAAHDVSAMELLMQYGARTDRLDGLKSTPLHNYAATFPVHFDRRVCVGEKSTERQQTIEDLLVKSTADISQKDRQGCTPLHLACETGQLSLIESLLSHCARTDLVDNDSRSVLHAIAMRFRHRVSITDNRQMLESIVRKLCCQKVEPGGEGTSTAGYQDIINCPDCHGRTPLHLAADCGDLTLVEMFLKLNAKVDVQDKKSRTPLHLAAGRGDLVVMDVLIAHGARLDIVDIEEGTPLHLYDGAHGDVFNQGKVRCWKKADETKIAWRREFQEEIAKNRRNARGQTPLHLAARRSAFNFLKLLLNVGAKADLVDDDNRLPLHYMAARKIEKYEDRELRKSAETLLVRSTPDINVQDSLRKTPLHCAAEQGSLSLVVSLLERGARTDLPDKKQQLPLHLMSQRAVDSHTDRETLVQAEASMVKKTADTNVKDLNGKTPLHLAAEKGSLSLMMSLLERGARADLVDKEQHLPLRLIALRPVFGWDDNETRSKVQTVLVEKTADVDVQDGKGKTLLHLAIEQNNWALTLSLLQQRARTDLADNEQRRPLHLLAAQRTDTSEVKEKWWEVGTHLVKENTDANRKLRNKAEVLLVKKTSDVNIQDSEGKTPLHLALERCNVSLTASLLKHGARTDVVDKAQRCPLHTMVASDTDRWESEESRIRAEALMVQKSDDINLQDSQGETPLHLAVRRCNVSLIVSLLEHGARTDVVDKAQRCPLHTMADTDTDRWLSQESWIRAEALMVEKTDDVNRQDSEGKTPLHLAAEQCNLSIIFFLLKSGARIDVEDKAERSPFQVIATKKKVEISSETDIQALTLMMEKSESVDALTKERKTLLHLAAERGILSWIVLLLERGAATDLTDNKGRLPLHALASRRLDQFHWEERLEAETLLVEKTADINMQDRRGRTPLHLALTQGHSSLAVSLLEHGAWTDLVDKQQRTPLHRYATGRHGGVEVETLLMKKVSEINAQDLDGKTPLHLAAEQGDMWLMLFLLRHGANADLKDKMGRCSLHALAAGKAGQENKSITRDKAQALLLKKTADVNARDIDEKTPLHLAAERLNFSLIIFLLDYGAKTDVMDKKGRLPLHLFATKYMREEFDFCAYSRAVERRTHTRPSVSALTCLLEKTADINMRDRDGKTALHLSLEHRSPLVTQSLLEHGARTDLGDDDHCLPLHCAVAPRPHLWGKTSSDQNLLVSLTSDLSAQDKNGKTALHLAVEQEDSRFITILVQQSQKQELYGNEKQTSHQSEAMENAGSEDDDKDEPHENGTAGQRTALINVQDNRGKTALHLAVEGQQWKVETFLLNNGARADLMDKDKRQPLHYLADNLNRSWEGEKALTFLLDKTADVNAQDKDGNTALHRAVEKGFDTLVTSLLERGAKMDVLNHERRLPLHIMAIRTMHMYTRTKPEQLLVEKTADINVQDTEGKTPLHLAAEKSNLPLMISLLEKDAKTDLSDTDGRLPLHVMAAARWCGGHGSSVSAKAGSLLVEKTPDIDIQDKQGKSPLHLAIENFKWSLAKLLLQQGAKTDLVDDFARNPLHKMANNQSLGLGNLTDEVEALLVEKSVNVNAQDTSGKAPLHLAAERFIPSLIEALLKREASTDLKDTDGRVPLHAMAARSPFGFQDRDVRVQTEALLVKKTADIDVQDRNGKTPLHLAAETGNLPLMISLLERGARAGFVDDEQCLPLHLLFVDSEAMVKLLVEKTPDINLQDKDGATPLHLAAGRGCASLVAALLEAGARTDLLDSEQRLPLHVVSLSWMTGDSLNLLLENTDDINVQDKAGKTPLHYACRQGLPSLAVSLLERGARTDVADSKSRLPLHMAAARRFDTEVDREALHQVETRVVEKTADVNARDTHCRTPLHHAALQYNPSLVAALLERGAGADVVDSDGCLPLHLIAISCLYPFEIKERESCLYNDGDSIDAEDTMLLEKTADVNVQDKHGKTPLHLAAERGRAPLVSALLKLGARADLVDQDGRTPLHLVAAQGSYQRACGGTWDEIEALLREKSSDINVQDKDGKTPLHLAVEGGRLSLVTSLLESGARTDLMDNDLRCPLHLVVAENFAFLRWRNIEPKVKVVYLLVQKTADISVRDKDGKTPLVLALEREDRKLVSMLLHHGGKGDILLKEGISWPADLGYVSEWMGDFTPNLVHREIEGGDDDDDEQLPHRPESNSSCTVQ